MKQATMMVVVVLLAGCASKPPESTPRPMPRFTEVPRRPDYATSEVARRGWQLYQNVAARELAVSVLPPGALSKVSGVVARPTSAGYLVRFCGIEAEGPASYFDIEIREKTSAPTTAKQNEPPLVLSGPDLAIWRAQAAWLPRLSSVETCAPQSHTVAFLTEDGDGWLSYLVPMPDSPGFMQLGGFHRLRLDATGKSVLDQIALFSECGGWRNPADAVAFVIAQVEDRIPSESYVYSSLFWNLPLFVSNAENDTVWAVDDGGVHDVSDRFGSRAAAQQGVEPDVK